jgi:hypothetical protein
MSKRTIIAAMGSFILIFGLGVHAAVRSDADGRVVDPDVSPRNVQKSVVLRPVNPLSSVRVMNVRLEPPPADAPNPSAVLKFDILNDSESSVTDIVIQIAMLEKPRVESVPNGERFVVNPFTIQGSVTLEAGYTVNFAMLLRNLSADCGCVPNVVVLSARRLPDPS